MILQIAKILMYVSIFSVFIPIFLLLRRKQNFKITPIKLLGMLLFVSAFSDIGSLVIIKMGHSNIAVANIFFVIQFLLISCIYYSLLKNNKIIYLFCIIYIVSFIINSIFIQHINEYQSWSNAVGGILILIYTMCFYNQILKTRVDVMRYYPFWLNSAIFYYFAFNLFLFTITNYIFKTLPTDISIIAWSFHNINTIIKYIFLVVAFNYVGINQQKEEKLIFD